MSKDIDGEFDEELDEVGNKEIDEGGHQEVGVVEEESHDEDTINVVGSRWCG